MVKLTEAELLAAVSEFVGGDLSQQPIARLHRLITISQFTTDTILNEIENRGELTEHEGMPIIPYMSDVFVETVLTRAA